MRSPEDFPPICPVRATAMMSSLKCEYALLPELLAQESKIPSEPTPPDCLSRPVDLP